MAMANALAPNPMVDKPCGQVGDNGQYGSSSTQFGPAMGARARQARPLADPYATWDAPPEVIHPVSFAIGTPATTRMISPDHSLSPSPAVCGEALRISAKVIRQLMASPVPRQVAAQGSNTWIQPAGELSPSSVAGADLAHTLAPTDTVRVANSMLPAIGEGKGRSAATPAQSFARGRNALRRAGDAVAPGTTVNTEVVRVRSRSTEQRGDSVPADDRAAAEGFQNMPPQIRTP